MIKKASNGTFIVDISLGRNKRIRRRFKTRTEATRYERHSIGQMEQDKDWTPEIKDIRKLSDLINIWYQLHGNTLKDGERVRNRMLIISKRKVKFLTDAEIRELINAIDHEDTRQAVKLCLSTDARMG
ncbi:MAG: hypothetical protein PSN35_07145 [Candidatus Thioglobus sp.]|uniref:phage integrase n=1 Tax=Candidatus Thioglobus sp. TaxID=2026721 RepID=UPI002624079F|nr:hypothetical protein [Candidatus Thioglobus sp.]MDC9727593.1 hypothetical protein [Candidatus Thioglobus sp.]